MGLAKVRDAFRIDSRRGFMGRGGARGGKPIKNQSRSPPQGESKACRYDVGEAIAVSDLPSKEEFDEIGMSK